MSKPVITNVDGEINEEVELNNLGVTSKSDSALDLAEAIRNLYKKSRRKKKKWAEEAGCHGQKKFILEK